MVASEPVVPEGEVPARLQTERTQKLHSGGCTSGGLLSCGSTASRRAAEGARLPKPIARREPFGDVQAAGRIRHGSE